LYFHNLYFFVSNVYKYILLSFSKREDGTWGDKQLLFIYTRGLVLLKPGLWSWSRKDFQPE